MKKTGVFLFNSKTYGSGQIKGFDADDISPKSGYLEGINKLLVNGQGRAIFIFADLKIHHGGI